MPLEVTPKMLTAAWDVIAPYWPRKIVMGKNGVGMLIHDGPWLRPIPCPAFKEAIEAAFKEMGDVVVLKREDYDRLVAQKNA